MEKEIVTEEKYMSLIKEMGFTLYDKDEEESTESYSLPIETKVYINYITLFIDTSIDEDGDDTPFLSVCITAYRLEDDLRKTVIMDYNNYDLNSIKHINTLKDILRYNF